MLLETALAKDALTDAGAVLLDGVAQYAFKATIDSARRWSYVLPYPKYAAPEVGGG